MFYYGPLNEARAAAVALNLKEPSGAGDVVALDSVLRAVELDLNTAIKRTYDAESTPRLVLTAGQRFIVHVELPADNEAVLDGNMAANRLAVSFRVRPESAFLAQVIESESDSNVVHLVLRPRPTLASVEREATGAKVVLSYEAGGELGAVWTVTELEPVGVK